MTFVDFIIFLLSLFLIYRGFLRGFLRSLLGPFSIIITTIISIVYFQATKDMAVSLAIGLIGPMVLHFILRLFLNAVTKITSPGFISATAGALLTLAWGWVFIALTLVLLAVLPPMGRPLQMLHQNVVGSLSYACVKPWSDKFFPSGQRSASPPTASGTNADMQTLAQDPRFQKVLQDPEVQNEINAHDFAKLMSNPKIMDLTKELMSDPAALKKVLQVYSSQAQPQAGMTASQPSQ